MKEHALRKTRPRFFALGIPFLAVSVLLAGCALATDGSGKAPLRTVAHVDLKRYMGEWRVISEIPYFAEKDCVDSVENYRLLADGTIYNWFTYRKKSFAAPEKKITAHAIIVNQRTNAEWTIKFLGGLISAKYLVIDLDPDYRWTVVGHPSRNYGWIMAREKTLPKETRNAILKRLAAKGYDVSRFKMVPQSPSQLAPRAKRQ
jgi:apolipoprotein D and lipocalin family protein